jgi:histone-lysine N-methyltransferase SETMAR
MGLSLQHLLRYADEGEDMLNRIVTGDESWVHHYQPGSKRASMQWKHASSLSRSTKKFKVMPSSGKVMLTVFWDSQGALLTLFQKRGENVNSASYCEVLLNIIRRKPPRQLARGVLLHHDNARPHRARATQERTQELQWELHPPYSPDLAPSNFHLFGPLRNHLGGKCFAEDGEVETEVRKWLRQQSNNDFYAAGFDSLAKRLDKCINVCGGYTEN